MMFKLLDRIQTLLDEALLQYGITSHYKIKPKSNDAATDAYAVYRIVSSTAKIRGDGKELIHKYIIDVNFYYEFKKVSNTDVSKYVDIILKTMEDDGFTSSNYPIPLDDLESLLAGINLEFSKIEVL